jgi:hypothetical protein
LPILSRIPKAKQQFPARNACGKWERWNNRSMAYFKRVRHSLTGRDEWGWKWYWVLGTQWECNSPQGSIAAVPTFIFNQGWRTRIRNIQHQAANWAYSQRESFIHVVDGWRDNLSSVDS